MTSPNFGKAGEVYVPARDSPMIKAFAIGNVVSACQSAEEEYCRLLLFRALARFDAPVWRVPSGSIFELASLVAQLAADAHLPQAGEGSLMSRCATFTVNGAVATAAWDNRLQRRLFDLAGDGALPIMD